MRKAIEVYNQDANLFVTPDGEVLGQMQWLSQCYEEERTLQTAVHCEEDLLASLLIQPPYDSEYPASDIYYYHSDHLGSASWITKSSGEPVQYIHYMPYGELWKNQQRTPYNERFKFTGKERDEETGYDYFGARSYTSAFSIWLSPDPLLDKYPNISSYAYCSWNPLKYVDPDGRIIKFASGTTKTQKQQFWETIRYLDAHNCGGRYGQLKQSKITYIIDMNSEKSQFVVQKSKTPTIYWNPNKGLETDNGIVISPATILNHEMTHATHFDDAKIQQDSGNFNAWNKYIKSTRKGTSKAYLKEEEERVITGIEQRTALKLGEIDQGQVTRSNHKGKSVYVESPTSNKKIE